MPTVATGMLWAVLVTFAALTLGSGVRIYALRNESKQRALKLRSSLFVWWLLTTLFLFSLFFGTAGLAVFLCVAGLISLREFHQLFSRRSFDSPILALTVAALGIGHYALLVFSNAHWSIWGLPWIVLALLSLIEILLGRTQDYLRATAGYTWAFALMIIGLSHVILLATLPETSHIAWGSLGGCLFLVLLTESNDIAQALVGRKYGKRKVAPDISPGKSWEGLAGGLLVTVLLSITLAPWLTNLADGKSQTTGLLLSACAGILISITGFLGDLNMSCLKREAGVRDSSNLLPGMGGMIDRIDSLTVTAPAFYYFTLLVG